MKRRSDKINVVKSETNKKPRISRLDVDRPTRTSKQNRVVEQLEIEHRFKKEDEETTEEKPLRNKVPRKTSQRELHNSSQNLLSEVCYIFNILNSN